MHTLSRAASEPYSIVQPEHNGSVRRGTRSDPESLSSTSVSGLSCRKSLVRQANERLQTHKQRSETCGQDDTNQKQTISKHHLLTFTDMPQGLHPFSKTLAASSGPITNACLSPNYFQKGKRKRDCEDQPLRKRVNDCQPVSIAGTDTVDIKQPDEEETTDPVAYWASHHRWPNNFATMNQGGSSSLWKQPLIQIYSQSYSSGELPRAHAQQRKRILAKHGLYMEEGEGERFISQQGELLCQELLQVSSPPPQYTSYPLTEFEKALERARWCNKTRLFRNITPLLVPSPELLFLSGYSELEHIIENLNVEWTKCKTLGGPRPKPDQAIGIAESAFDETELIKLQNHTSFERATLFGDNVYFPFLLVEVENSDVGLKQADCQNMHSCSIVLDAILQLYLVLDNGRQKAAELNGEVMLFSISHDDRYVRLCAHIAVVDKKISFYRYFFEEFSLGQRRSRGRERTYNFVRAVYDIFYPKHLARIRKVLAEMPEPEALSTAATMSV